MTDKLYKICIFLLSLLILSRGTTTNVTVYNFLPNVSAINITPNDYPPNGFQVNLSGSAVTVYAIANISDNNGYHDINQSRSYCQWIDGNTTLAFANCANLTCTVICNKTFTSSYVEGNYSVTIVACDVYSSTNQSATFYFYNPSVVPPPSYSYSYETTSVISVVAPPAVAGCSSDTNCSLSQKCVNSACVNISCACGHVQNRACNPYQCCSDEACGTEQRCISNSCVAITGTCGYAENHTWVKHACCLDDDCQIGERCEDHQCAAKKANPLPNMTIILNESRVYSPEQISASASLLEGVIPSASVPVQISINRSIVMERTESGGEIKFVVVVTLSLMNNQTQALKNVILIEPIPSELASDLNEIVSENAPEVIGNALLSWKFDRIEPGETETIVYELHKEVDTAVFRNYGTPVLFKTKTETVSGLATLASMLMPNMSLNSLLMLIVSAIVLGAIAFLCARALIKPRSPQKPRKP